MADRDTLALPIADTLSGDEWLAIVQGGNSRRVQLSTLKTFVNTNPTVVPSSVPFRGAQLVRTSDVALSAITTITWQSASSGDGGYDTDALWSAGSPTRLTIPAGITRVNVSCGARVEATAAANTALFLRKNGAYIGQYNYASGWTSQAGVLTRTGIPVVAGDYFEVVVELSNYTNKTLKADPRTFFSLEIVEATI